MPRLILPTVALALILAAPSGAAEKVTDSDRFKLWDGCRPMHLVVENLPKDATEIGLTKKAITVMARSRLRAARLYSSAPVTPFLFISVTVVGAAFSVLVTYDKWMTDRASGVSRGVSAWMTGSTGTHGGGNAPYILSSVSQQVDKFIDEYLRVNESACRKSN